MVFHFSALTLVGKRIAIEPNIMGECPPVGGGGMNYIDQSIERKAVDSAKEAFNLVYVSVLRKNYLQPELNVL